jgi:hypothetical protein
MKGHHLSELVEYYQHCYSFFLEAAAPIAPSPCTLLLACRQQHPSCLNKRQLLLLLLFSVLLLSTPRSRLPQ